MNIFYNQIDLGEEEYVLSDDETTLRSWLTAMSTPADTWDTTYAPLLFNSVIGNKYGPFIASSGGTTYRNLWWSVFKENLAGSWVIDGKTYNRRGKWELDGAYAKTCVGTLTFYYNSR